MIKLNGKEVEFEKFPNGELRLVEESINRQSIGLLFPEISFKYEDDSDLIKLMFVKEYINTLSHLASENATLNIYYMPYSRMDRSENKSPFTLKYVAKFINNLEFKRVSVVEPHSDVTPALLDNCTPVMVNEKLLGDVMKEVNFDLDIDYVVYPNADAQKRYGNIFKGNSLIGHKERDFQTGRIKNLQLVGDLSEGIYSESKAIIVDDLSSYGGTFALTAQELRKLGFKEVYLLVAHAENSIFKGSLFDNIEKVFTTDSILTEQNYPHNRKYESQLKVYDIEDVIKL